MPKLKPPQSSLWAQYTEKGEDDCSLLERLATIGPVVKVSTLRKQYLINEADAIYAILCRHAKHYNKKRVGITRLAGMAGTGLITLSDQAWQEARQRLHAGFQTQLFSQHLPEIQAITAHHTKQWLDVPTAAEINLVPRCLALALEVNATVLCGTTMHANPQTITELATQAVNMGCRAWSLRPWTPSLKRLRYQKLSKPLHTWANQMIHRMLNAANPSGLLLPLIEAYKAQHISHAQLCGEFKNILFAGYEATGVALAWLLHDLSMHQAQQNKAYQEQLNADANCLEDLKAWTFIDRIIAESLRLHPPVFVMERRSKTCVQLCGHTLPAGALLIISPYLIHRHPAYWPQPASYNPDRFLLPTSNRPKGCYIPFGLGPRTCIGMQLGNTLLKIMLGNILNQYKLTSSNKAIEMGQGQITLKPKHGLHVILQLR